MNTIIPNLLITQGLYCIIYKRGHVIEKAPLYLKDFSPEGNNISYPKFEIIFSVAKDWITLFVCSSNFSCNIFNATSVLYIS
ncbi:hypothetical protein FML83_28050 [Bacillus thuringiensis]|uniref:Uncharacterized protein n=1 Tax=Bacillus thuringiensis TaxID=1428 RepID=A0AAP4QCN1_BACTU|nr:hypothetical protein [Bacillus thuringiensis]MDN7081414.1 hypothetical protein [Bacillus thuringiensis]MDQ7258423.1 hypothetical protein [Bacillus thuringiensis]MDR5032133.1 hypothetical protein [Bacillus thuringiensis]MDV6354164.1 hypothetical protein [Bacillus thuringiensis]